MYMNVPIRNDISFHCICSPIDEDLPGPCDAVHPDQEAGPPHAHPAGPDWPKGGRAPWQPFPDPEVGESQVRLCVRRFVL